MRTLISKFTPYTWLQVFWGLRRWPWFWHMIYNCGSYFSHVSFSSHRRRRVGTNHRWPVVDQSVDRQYPTFISNSKKMLGSIFLYMTFWASRKLRKGCHYRLIHRNIFKLVDSSIYRPVSFRGRRFKALHSGGFRFFFFFDMTPARLKNNYDVFLYPKGVLHVLRTVAHSLSKN